MEIWLPILIACFCYLTPSLLLFKNPAPNKKLSGQVNFLGIAYQDEEKKSIAAAYKWQLPFPSVQDPRSLLREFYAINGLPVTLLVDKEGKVVERIAGPIGSPEDFTNRVSGKLISY